MLEELGCPFVSVQQVDSWNFNDLHTTHTHTQWVTTLHGSGLAAAAAVPELAGASAQWSGALMP